MYIRGGAASLQHSSGLPRGKVPLFATLAGAQKEKALRVPEASANSSRQTKALLVRLSPNERRTVAERGDLCDQCLSTYMRRVALGSIRRARPRRIQQKAVYQPVRIGHNLNKLTRVANLTGQVDTTHRLGQVLAEIIEAIRKLA